MADELDVKPKREERIRQRRAEEERKRKQQADEFDKWDRENPPLNLGDGPRYRENPYNSVDHRPEELKWAWDLLQCIEEEASNPEISPEEKAKLLEEAATQRKHAENLQAPFTKQANKELFWFSIIFFGIPLAIVIGLLAAAPKIRPYIIKINIWGTIIAIPLLGVLLYWIRSRKRVWYGTAETIVGMFSALSVFVPTFDYSRLNATGCLQVLAGLYIIVRGLDNMGNGLKGTRYERFWNRVF